MLFLFLLPCTYHIAQDCKLVKFFLGYSAIKLFIISWNLTYGSISLSDWYHLQHTHTLPSMSKLIKSNIYIQNIIAFICLYKSLKLSSNKTSKGVWYVSSVHLICHCVKQNTFSDSFLQNWSCIYSLRFVYIKQNCLGHLIFWLHIFPDLLNKWEH